MAYSPRLLGQPSPPSHIGEKLAKTWDILQPYVTGPYDAFWRLAQSPAASGFEFTEQNAADALTAGGGVMMAGSVVPKPANALNMGIRGIKNLKGQTIAPPREFYRGQNPGRTERISTGVPTWDRYLFAADNEPAARMYGSDIEKITAHPDAKILYEGTADWNKIAGRIKKNENMLQYADRAAKAAKEAGYDAAWFKMQGDIGTAIFNPDKFVRGSK